MRVGPGDEPLDDAVRARLEALFASRSPHARPDPNGVGGPAAQSRFRFGRAHATALAVLCGLALLVAVFGVLRARPVPVQIEVTPQPVRVEASPSPTPVPLVWVHVLGAVASPGVISLPAGARVADAIRVAGGLTADARPGNLNLAAVVPDGAQVLIGTKATPGGELRLAPGTAAITGPGMVQLDLNSATAEQLDGLPGVGPVTAAAILAWRDQHGRFSSIAELQEVQGIGPKTFSDIKPYVRV